MSNYQGYGAAGAPKQDTAPPPPYSEFGPSSGTSGSSIAPQPPSSSPQPIPLSYPQPPHAPYPNIHPNAVPYSGHAAGGHPHHQQFGPTPLNDTQVLLPYGFYSERAIVDVRARWRFCNALLCALGIYVGVAFLQDEDFISRSLLDSLDAQADAEPTHSTDSDGQGPSSYKAPSDSSSNSSSVAYPVSLLSQHQQLVRSDSPLDHQRLLHQLQDPSYTAHHAGLYNHTNNMNIQPDYMNEYDTNKLSQQHGGKLNGFGASSYRASFTAFPNSNRTHQLNSPSFRDTHNFYQPNEAFPSQATSPMQSFEPHGSFDFMVPQQGLNGHKGYLESYSPNPISLLAHHNNPKSNGPMAQSHSKFPSSHPYSGLTSQTPYGPHIPASGMTNAPNTGPVASTNSAISSSTPNNSNQEEISTIFVVGFPEDMQEREFQNMFTFSPGFEAATLKIPNKEYTAYGARGYQGYNGSNDPYNLVTVNQGGVVVDGGRDGTMSSWPTAPGDDGTNPHFIANANMPPRKQIIGFAKFKSRDAALEARDVLQGRRVDIEKGAVLKAEMAKKNLHTKRGVGPVAGPAIPAGPQNASNINGISMGSHGSDSYAMANDPYARPDAIDLARPGTWRDQLQRDVHAVTNGIGSAQTAEFHPRKDREDEDRRRERESSLYSAMGFPNAIGQPSATRGPRERAEDEDRRRKEKDRFRASNSNAFDGYHPAPPPLSRQNSGMNINGVSLLPPPMESGSGLGSSPLLASAFAAAPNVNHQSAFHSSQNDDLSIGPWDNVRTSVTASRSSSRRSTSPGDPDYPAPGDDDFEHGPPHRTHSETSSSSINGSQGPGVIGGPGSTGGSDIDLLVLNTDNGTTSPQLPSPDSGASSTSTRNAIDQNPPINTLYVGNLPTSPPPLGFSQDYLEESIRQLFSAQPGYRRLCFRQKGNGPMCFVEFEDVNHASKALNELYGNTLNGLVKHGGIRLSYSKNPLGVRTPTSATSPNGSLSQQQQALQALVFPQDPFRGEEIQQTTPTGISRRDGAGNYGNSFMTSPPPRFTSPPATLFGQPALTNTNLFPLRSNGGSLASLYSYNLAPASSSSPFAPFGMTSPPTIPEQSNPGDPPSLHSSHFSHRTLSPPVHSVEATRAG